MANELIREALSAAGVRHWQLAAALGVHESTLCHRLRSELPEADAEKMLELIEKLTAEREKRG